jgi:hypothetical protein
MPFWDQRESLCHQQQHYKKRRKLRLTQSRLIIDMYPFWIYQKIPGEDLHGLKKNGTNITFHGDYVRFEFPNCEILSESRKILIGDTKCVSFVIYIAHYCIK